MRSSFVVVFHVDDATENTYTPARLEALFELSVVTILRHSYRSRPIFLRIVGVLSHSSSCSRSHRTVLAWCLQCRNSIFVHVNANLSLSRKIDQFRMLSRLSLDITAIFATGYTLCFRVSYVVIIFNCSQCAKFLKENWSMICSVVRLIIDTVC